MSQLLSPFNPDPNRPIREQINLWMVGSVEHKVVVVIHAATAEQALLQGKAMLSADPMNPQAKAPLPKGTPIGILPFVAYEQGMRVADQMEMAARAGGFKKPSLYVP